MYLKSVVNDWYKIDRLEFLMSIDVLEIFFFVEGQKILHQGCFAGDVLNLVCEVLPEYPVADVVSFILVFVESF